MAKSYTIWIMKKKGPEDVDYATSIKDARKKAYEDLKNMPIGTTAVIVDDYGRGSGEVGVVKKTSSVHKYMLWYPKEGWKHYLRADGTIFEKE